MSEIKGNFTVTLEQHEDESVTVCVIGEDGKSHCDGPITMWDASIHIGAAILEGLLCSR